MKISLLIILIIPFLSCRNSNNDSGPEVDCPAFSEPTITVFVVDANSKEPITNAIVTISDAKGLGGSKVLEYKTEFNAYYSSTVNLNTNVLNFKVNANNYAEVIENDISFTIIDGCDTPPNNWVHEIIMRPLENKRN